MPSANVPQVRLSAAAPRPSLCARSRDLMPFKHREVVEHSRPDLGVDAELLRQIAEDAAHFVLLREHIDAVERDGPAVGILQRRDACASA